MDICCLSRVSLQPLEAFIVVHHWQLNFPASNKELHVGQREQALLFLSCFLYLCIREELLRTEGIFVSLRVSILDTFRRFESRLSRRHLEDVE
jgi:hypothetical protein